MTEPVRGDRESFFLYLLLRPVRVKIEQIFLFFFDCLLDREQFTLKIILFFCESFKDIFNYVS